MTFLGINLQSLLLHAGPTFAFAIIFCESFFLFFLPGDSFIFTAGLLASQHLLALWSISIFMIVGAILGNIIGYYLGKNFGVKLFTRRSKIFTPDGLEKTQAFYDKYGPLTVVLGRFTPFVRTFVPILAGSGEMDYPTFLIYSTGGAILWVLGVGLLGYFLGRSIPNIDRYILPIIGLIIIVSLIPPLFGAWRHSKSKASR